jgi:hypothetical protein
MKKSMIACLAVVLVLAGGMIALLGPRHCPVNRVAFERIEKGMTRAEVRAILGGPAGDFTTRPTSKAWAYDDLTSPQFKDERDDWATEIWAGDQGYVMVIFEPGGGVYDAQFLEELEPEPVGSVELVRWRLGKLKEALLPRAG